MECQNAFEILFLRASSVFAPQSAKSFHGLPEKTFWDIAAFNGPKTTKHRDVHNDLQSVFHPRRHTPPPKQESRP